MHASLGLLERGASSGKPAASDHILAFAEECRRLAKSMAIALKLPSLFGEYEDRKQNKTGKILAKD